VVLLLFVSTLIENKMKKTLTQYWVCTQNSQVTWFIFAPTAVDEKRYREKGDFYSWWVKYTFYAQPVHESVYCVTNKEWQCHIQEYAPYFGEGYVKSFGSSHHWAYKKFQVYDAPAPGLMDVRIGNPSVHFYAYSSLDEAKSLSPYWAVSIGSGTTEKWWVVSPVPEDFVDGPKNSYWSWTLRYTFYAKKLDD